MKLFIGFIGRTRDGDVVEIVNDNDGIYFSSDGTSYHGNGCYFGSIPPYKRDIISEIEPARTQKVFETLPKDFVPSGYQLTKQPENVSCDKLSNVDVLINALKFYAGDFQDMKLNRLYNAIIKHSNALNIDGGEIARKALTEYKGETDEQV